MENRKVTERISSCNIITERNFSGIQITELRRERDKYNAKMQGKRKMRLKSRIYRHEIEIDIIAIIF